MEMDHPSALDFCEKKQKILKAKEDRLTESIAELKGDIRLVVEGIRELQSLPVEKEKGCFFFSIKHFRMLVVNMYFITAVRLL